MTLKERHWNVPCPDSPVTELSAGVWFCCPQVFTAAWSALSPALSDHQSALDPLSHLWSSFYLTCSQGWMHLTSCQQSTDFEKSCTHDPLQSNMSCSLDCMACDGQRLSGRLSSFWDSCGISASIQDCWMHRTPLKTHTFLEELPGKQMEYPWALEIFTRWGSTGNWILSMANI